MSKKKNNLSEELLNLKLREEPESSLAVANLDLDMSDIKIAVDEDGSPKKSEDTQAKDNNTLRLIQPLAPKNPEPLVKAEDEEAIRVSYGLPSKQQVPKNLDLSLSGVDGTLKQSEHLRIAQRKITDLEEEIFKLRQENEELASAGSTFKKLNDEYFVQLDQLKTRLADQTQTMHQEIDLLKKINQNKDKQINEYKQQIEEYKSKIENNFQRVRKREKDLEHRLEIARIEEAALVKSKDQLILDLKRRIDDLTQESDNFRKKSQENYQELQKKQQVMRGVIRALRIALTKLEGDDSSDYGIEDVVEGGDES